MNILSIDTSTMMSSTALMEDGIILADFNLNQEKTHSESLVPMIEYMLHGLGMTPADVDVFAVSVGPGSFTGIRIGMTVAKTMAQVFQKPIYGVSTLQALACGLPDRGLLIPLLDARGGRVYYGEYRWEGDIPISLDGDDLIESEDLFAQLKEVKEPMVFLGEIAAAYREQIDSLHQARISLPMQNSCFAKQICYLAERKYKAKQPSEFDIIRPNYVRKSQAQRELEMRKNNGSPL